MCMFRYLNNDERGEAYKHGLKYFECGGCPECLQKKSRVWALRASMEAKNNIGMMITLTYDTYIYDSRGQIIGENLNLQNPLSKKDIQNFFKRLRAKFPERDIKYIAAAERGKRTNRPHYHCIVFGLVFDDLVYYKKSKRGNLIYRSKTLEKIWHGGREKKGGICTVDSVNPNASVARYCTKYCAKDAGVDDTFMLFSHGIGDEMLLKYFNGKSYWIEGREYPIPRRIWTKFIEKKYCIEGYSRYVAPPPEDIDFCNLKDGLSYLGRLRYLRKRKMLHKKWLRAFRKRELFSYMRDNDYLYKRYIDYWSKKSELYEKYQAKPFYRVLALPDEKYRTYKVKALNALMKRKKFEPFVPPRSNCTAIYKRAVKEKYGFGVESRHYTPNDSIFARVGENQKMSAKMFTFLASIS